MNSSRPLLRDYGLAVGLVVASVLLFWKTMLPQIRRNRLLDQALIESREQSHRLRQDMERLRALEDADWDPLVVERLARQLFQSLGLEAGETMVPRSTEVEES